MPEAAPDDLTADALTKGTGQSTGTDDKSDTGDTKTSTQQATSTQKADTNETETVEYWKKRSRENEAKAKANAGAAKELEGIKDKDKTENERLTEALAKAEQEKAAAETGLLRASVAAEKGLPPELASRLTGSTKDEIEADADDLLKVVGSAGGPGTDLKQGGRGADTGQNDVDSWIRSAAGRNSAS